MTFKGFRLLFEGQRDIASWNSRKGVCPHLLAYFKSFRSMSEGAREFKQLLNVSESGIFLTLNRFGFVLYVMCALILDRVQRKWTRTDNDNVTGSQMGREYLVARDNKLLFSLTFVEFFFFILQVTAIITVEILELTVVAHMQENSANAN